MQPVDDATLKGHFLTKVIDSADAYLVVYAIDDRESFKGAQTIVSEILGRCKIASAIVLVGNKTDLVRARCVSYDEGKHLASVYSCDFYEVSISLNHRVNELLVGLVSAIKAANQHVNEERQRLSRIASLKGDPSEASSSHEHRTSMKQKLKYPRRYSSVGKSIRHFFKNSSDCPSACMSSRLSASSSTYACACVPACVYMTFHSSLSSLPPFLPLPPSLPPFLTSSLHPSTSPATLDLCTPTPPFHSPFDQSTHQLLFIRFNCLKCQVVCLCAT
ncbi:GTP-binding protein RAD [Echinococcus granulosus]|uniref:GTP-binding protein RAD n=1 Tax=Echinococcus granulosus TaxID=6210 RepID=W6UPF2_ECHGR|nr:GTP-binding protein RAD [Echinococcus granulosus]EUB55299.1 GTP-binding protein RAD [Echinococcus granulosus]